MFLFRRTGASLSHALLALVASLCVLVAPLCASLCFANSCAAATGMPSCHETSPASRSGASFALADTCARVNLSAMLPKSEESFSSLGRPGNAAIRSVKASKAFSLVVNGSYSRFGTRAPSGRTKSLPASSILRI